MTKIERSVIEATTETLQLKLGQLDMRMSDARECGCAICDRNLAYSQEVFVAIQAELKRRTAAAKGE